MDSRNIFAFITLKPRPITREEAAEGIHALWEKRRIEEQTQIALQHELAVVIKEYKEKVAKLKISFAIANDKIMAIDEATEKLMQSGSHPHISHYA